MARAIYLLCKSYKEHLLRILKILGQSARLCSIYTYVCVYVGKVSQQNAKLDLLQSSQH